MTPSVSICWTNKLTFSVLNPSFISCGNIARTALRIGHKITGILKVNKYLIENIKMGCLILSIVTSRETRRYWELNTTPWKVGMRELMLPPQVALQFFYTEGGLQHLYARKLAVWSRHILSVHGALFSRCVRTWDPRVVGQHRDRMWTPWDGTKKSEFVDKLTAWFTKAMRFSEQLAGI